jgi:hypothetical protein
MNVTLKIDDEICREARHRAVDAGRSLSGWITDVIQKELSSPHRKKPKTLLDALGNDELADIDLTFPRETSSIREADFS